MKKNDEKSSTRYVEFTRVGKTYRQFWWIIVLFMLVVMVLSAGYQYHKRNSQAASKMYSSTAQVFLQQEKPEESTFLGVNYSALLVSDNVLEKISKEVDMDTADIKTDVYFAQNTGSKVLTVMVLADTKDHCDTIMNGVMKYGFENVKEVTGDSQLAIVQYPQAAVAKHVVQNTTSLSTGVTFDNPTGKYTITDWNEFVQSELSLTALLKKVLVSGFIALVVGVILMFVYAILSRRIEYREDLRNFGFIGCTMMDEDAAYVKTAAAIQRASDNAAVVLRTAGSGAVPEKDAAGIAESLVSAGYKVAASWKAEDADNIAFVDISGLEAKNYASEIKEAKEKYDYILFNVNSGALCAAEVILQNACDETVLFVPKGSVKSDDLIEAVDDIRAADCIFTGTVMIPSAKIKEKHRNA